MNPKIVIRNETSADVGTIAEVTIAAFRTLEISNHTEQFTRRQCPHGITGRGSGRAFGRTYCVLSRDHFGRHSELVRTRTRFSVAGIPETRHREIPHS